MSGTVLVTGAAGFIGSHVVRELLELGHSVRGTVRNPANAEFLKALPGSERLEIVQMDLLQGDSVVLLSRGVTMSFTVLLHHVVSMIESLPLYPRE